VTDGLNAPRPARVTNVDAKGLARHAGSRSCAAARAMAAHAGGQVCWREPLSIRRAATPQWRRRGT